MHKLQTGQPLSIYAQDWNMMCDLVEQIRKGEENNAMTRSAIRTYVQIYNGTSIVAEEGSVWELSTPMIFPSDNLDDFKKHPVFGIKIPTQDTEGVLCVLTSPVNPSSQGIGVVAGGVALFASEAVSGASRAMPDGQGGVIAGTEGQIELAYADEATGWCYAILGAGGGGSSYNGYFKVSVKTVGDVKTVQISSGRYYVNGRLFLLPQTEVPFEDNSRVVLHHNREFGGVVGIMEPFNWTKTDTCTVIAEIVNGTVRQICHDMPTLFLLGKCGEDSP